MTILVTGATGTVGGCLVDQLLDAGQQVRALTRDAGQADRLPSGVEVCEGNFHDTASLRTALKGVERMYLFSDADTVRNVMAAVADSELARIVVLISDKDDTDSPGGGTHNPVEQAVQAAHVDWTFLRPGPFAMNALNWWAHPIREYGVVRWVYPDARLAPIHETDVADVAALTLLQDGHIGNSYTLTGPEDLTQAEQVRIIGQQIGRDIRYEELDPDEAKKMLLRNGLPAEVVDWLIPVLGSLVGAPDEANGNVEKLTGRPARTFAQWVTDHADAFGHQPA